MDDWSLLALACHLQFVSGFANVGVSWGEPMFGVSEPERLAQPCKIVAWNVCSGGGERVEAILAALETLAASTVVLSEITETRLHQWLGGLADIGFVHSTGTTDYVSTPELE